MPPARLASVKPGTAGLVAAIALVPAIVKLLCYPHNIGSDDAYIHLRIATNLVHGLGWGINPHQPVNLSTAPAFTLLLAAAEATTKHAIGATQLISVIAVIAGLVLIFLTVLSETGSINAALLGEVAAAFSVNLWRWNGALMEASYGFAVVALVLWMFREKASRTAAHFLLAGIVLGVGLLLRPEMGLLLVLCLCVQAARSAGQERVKQLLLIVVGVALPLIPWCLFASRHAGTIFPTTFAAKSTHLLLWNPTVAKQMLEVGGESILFPTLLICVLLLFARSFWESSSRPGKLAYVIPLGWLVGLSAFYYLKTATLQSPGRYVLPLLPCEATLIAFLWASVNARLPRWGRAMTVVAVSCHVIFAVVLNYLFVMPTLLHFEDQYAATMRATADELVLLTRNSANKRVLVNQDIGVLSCEADGRFEIYDGGGLASPFLGNLTTREQTEKIRPAFLVQSLALSPDGRGAFFPQNITELWERRFHRHGVKENDLYYYTTIYKVDEFPPSTP